MALTVWATSVLYGGGVGGVVQSANNRGLPYSATYSAAAVLLPPHHTQQPLPQRAARVVT